MIGDFCEKMRKKNQIFLKKKLIFSRFRKVFPFREKIGTFGQKLPSAAKKPNFPNTTFYHFFSFLQRG